MQTIRDKIIDALLQLPGITSREIEAAMEFQNRQGVHFGEALVRKGLISEKDLLLLLVRECQLPSVDLSKFRKIDDKLKEFVSERLARQYRLIPVSMIGQSVTVALSDPLNVFALDDLRNATGRVIEIVLAAPSQIEAAINRFYGAADQGAAADAGKNAGAEVPEIMSDGDTRRDVHDGDQVPIIRMVNLVIKEALRQRASDIHMEPSEADMRVRYRIDGVLQDVLEVPRESQDAVIARIRAMARMDMALTQVPQDGRFKMRLSGQEIDFRVVILPTCHGPKVVMRILDRSGLSVGLGHLGFSETSLRRLEEAIAKPSGMILVTGPTGSGKSTALYSIINQLNKPDKNIVTVEDPVEYWLDGLTQIEVDPDIGLHFASSLRAVLRQSPDVVMISEIRDNETADMAVKASLAGQLVLSTLHTHGAADALTRLVDMDVEPFLVASSVVLVCALRLCRKICPHCKEAVDVSDEALKRFAGELSTVTKFYAGKGCERCAQSGYLGRFGVTEVLVLDGAIREMLLEGKSAEDIKAYACRAQGMLTLWDDAIERIKEGQTTVEEVLRIVSSD